MIAWPHPASAVPLDVGAIEIETFGPRPEDSPTLVFLHEGLGSIAMWRDFPHALAARTGLGVLSYSRFGYGGSSAAALPRPIRYMHDEAARLFAVLAAAGVDRPILVGHSDGASIALLYTGGSVGPQPLALILEAPHVFVEDVTHASIAESAANREALLPRLARYHQLPVADVFRGWSDVWLDPEFRGWNIEASLAAVRAPTLIIQGADDPYGTWAQVEAIERGVGSGLVASIRIEACGHSPHREQTGPTLDAMTRFLATLETKNLVQV